MSVHVHIDTFHQLFSPHEKARRKRKKREEDALNLRQLIEEVHSGLRREVDGRSEVVDALNDVLQRETFFGFEGGDACAGAGLVRLHEGENRGGRGEGSGEGEMARGEEGRRKGVR
jgi:hypothetical protein